MRIAIGIVTYNAESTLRFDLLERTIESIREAFPDDPLSILDNGSDDGSTDTIRAMYKADATIVSRTGAQNTTPGAGRNALLPTLVEQSCDLVIMSDDDMTWHKGAREQLVAFWSGEVPHDLAILGGLLEPLYPWNTPRATLTTSATGPGAVVRDSVPGAAWSFYPGHALALPGYPAPFVDDFGYDHKHCVALGKMGLCVAAMDLAEHIGWGASTHGNRADTDIRAKPIDRHKWGV
jgi:glycosyltransferase involved in cell wall biosynthesis